MALRRQCYVNKAFTCANSDTQSTIYCYTWWRHCNQTNTFSSCVGSILSLRGILWKTWKTPSTFETKIGIIFNQWHTIPDDAIFMSELVVAVSYLIMMKLRIKYKACRWLPILANIKSIKSCLKLWCSGKGRGSYKIHSLWRLFFNTRNYNRRKQFGCTEGSRD